MRQGTALDIDPNLVNLLVSYAANVGADATAWVAGKFRRRVPGEVETGAKELNLSIQAQLTANNVSVADAEKIAEFLLHTPILGYLFMMVEEAARAKEYEGLANEEIAALILLETGIEGPPAAEAAGVIVDVLSAAIRTGKRPRKRPAASVTNRPLSGVQLFGAQEAKRRVLQEIGAPSLTDIAAYSAHFRREMRKKFSRIQLQHLDNGTEQKLSDLYVEPDLLKQDIAVGSKADFKPAQVLEHYAASVIQGPAGGGKSTIVRRLAADLAGRSDEAAVPIVVELRKYSAQQALAPQIFLEHIKQSVAQLTQQEPPSSWLEYILISGRAVVFFDGLDEVLSAGTRSDVRDAVRSFAQLFPASSFLVTSRYTGYDLAPLDRDTWAHFSVCELREDQVRDYAALWFKLKDPDSAIARATSFIDESRVYAPDLRANPLMLSLLCSVYYSRGDIPKTLYALYEQCADMIYRQWNTMRGIDDHRAWDKDVRPVLYQVAHTVLNNDDYISQGIPERDLIAEIQRAFLDNGAPDVEEASARARETLALWAGRAWIITPVMTESTGRFRYGFVHQSFLEYFAAVYEVRRVDTPAELYANLRSRLIELNGWTVTQIAVSVIQAWKDQGGRRFVEAVLSEIEEACDLDAYSLWRLLISLVSIVRMPAELLDRIVAGSIQFVARSIQVPNDDQTTYRANNQSRERQRDFNQFEQNRDGAIERELVRLPTAESDAVLHDLTELCFDDDTHAAMIPRSAVGSLKSERGDVVLSSLLLCATLIEAGVWPKELNQAADACFTDTRRERSWVEWWAAAQVGFVPLQQAVKRVPWHALLLHQELVLSSETEMAGPQPFTTDLLSAINQTETHLLLESIGETAASDIEAGKQLPSISRREADYFVFREPASDWSQAKDPSAWSNAFLTTFAMLGKLASLSWSSGHALGEIVNDSPRDDVRHIAASAVGWGSLEASTLKHISEPYSTAIRTVISESWPVSP